MYVLSDPNSVGLDPVIAARVLASYFKHRSGLVEACEQENWREVRRLVNGQYNGWERFHALVLPLAMTAKVAAAADDRRKASEVGSHLPAATTFPQEAAPCEG